jgi:hypothetical protein
VATLVTGAPVASGTAGGSELRSQQAASAKALVECLANSGIEADDTGRMVVNGYEGDFVVVSPVLHSDSYLIVDEDGGVEATEDYPPDKVDRTRPQLIDGDRDLSDEYVGCLESSGYFIPAGEEDPREEERVKQKSAAAGNLWAACARENGIPNIADVGVVVDGYKTKPEVLVPASVTPAQFEDVLEKCPPFDPDRDLTHGNMYEADEEAPEDPMIGFELPADDPVRAQLEQVVVNYTNAAYEKAYAK